MIEDPVCGLGRCHIVHLKNIFLIY
ncbi:hypothetical protein M4L39_13255 [Staphylococcus equorum]|uniref:Uncharacterized protein n=1 Tax=Staphylococcus equorum TaxID=246432 RepID=A0A9X4LBV1_9STAP|nr:hypothetical protein [Staphylococcus equorum]MDG0860645.1 hypothetical protein [Staphylococcus equorum]